jgi:hypothetical protein
MRASIPHNLRRPLQASRAIYGGRLLRRYAASARAQNTGSD